jgi:hypothetical protein
MCISAIIAWFKGNKTPQKSAPTPPQPVADPLPEPIPAPAPQPEPAPPQPPALTIPYPEEAADFSITMDNYDIEVVFNKWMLDYQVPAENYDHWRNIIEIEVTENLSSPAATWDNYSTHKRHLAVKPPYLNPGVLAHEQAHNSYALLTEQQKREFSTAYTPLKTSDPLIIYLYSINSYGTTSDIEGHAEIYRYLYGKMPEALKKYYPKLIP